MIYAKGYKSGKSNTHYFFFNGYNCTRAMSPTAPQAETSHTVAMRSTSSQSPAVQAELASATLRQGTSTQSPASVSIIECLRTTRGTQAEASVSRTRIIGACTQQSLPCRERTLQVQGMNEEEAEDIDQSSDEEDNTTIMRERAVRGPQVKFPTEEEFEAGYIWGHDAMFDTLIDNIRAVKHVEKNHRCLSQQWIREMYQRMARNEASLVTPLTLRPIAYIMEEVGPKNERRRREVPF
jgi:hypothetical protein